MLCVCLIRDEKANAFLCYILLPRRDLLFYNTITRLSFVASFLCVSYRKKRLIIRILYSFCIVFFLNTSEG